jgi:Uma2 family endonuclease
LINGEIIYDLPPKNDHQRVAIKLMLLLHDLIPSGEIMICPSSTHLDEYNVVEPDLFWVSGSHSRCKLGEDDWWHGAPDLVIEILSPSSRRHDRVEKFQLYEKHGVLEYWIIDPLPQNLEVWNLVDQAFQLVSVFSAEDSFESGVLNGAKIDLKVIFGEAK